MNKTFIYGLVDPSTNEIRYVGKTIESVESRLCKHLYDSNKRRHKTACWLKSLTRKNLKPSIVVLEECYEDWVEQECFWISYFKFIGARLTNHTSGGEGLVNYTHSVETRLKISLSNKGNKLSEERKEKLRLFHTGRKHTQESKDKMSLIHTGKKMSESAREKMRNNNLGKKLSQETKDKIGLASKTRYLNSRV